MKTLLAIAFMLVSLHAQAATLASTRLKVDTWLTNVWTGQIVPRQDTYYANNGRYWQGLLSCVGTNTIPNFTAASDGDRTADNLDSKPHYQAQSIADVFPELTGINLPCAFLCDQYRGPLGDGFVVTVFVRFNGTIYTRSRNRGPETWRSADWAAWNPSNL